MAEVLFTSEEFVKKVSSISDNVAGKYLLPSMREAQEIGLKSIIGENLYNKVKSILAAGTEEAPGNVHYKELLEHSQYYLAYTAIVELTNKVTYKIGNFGVAKSSDENLSVASQDELAKQMYYYQSKADAHCLALQNWVLENRSYFPELSESTAYKIKSNLHSAASCGLFLGGARGYIKRGRRTKHD